MISALPVLNIAEQASRLTWPLISLNLAINACIAPGQSSIPDIETTAFFLTVSSTSLSISFKVIKETSDLQAPRVLANVCLNASSGLLLKTDIASGTSTDGFLSR